MESLNWIKTVDEVLVFPEVFSKPTRVEFDFIESEIGIFITTIDELQAIDWHNIESSQIIKTLEINHLIINIIKYRDGNYSFVFPGIRLFYTAATILHAVNQLRNEYSA